ELNTAGIAARAVLKRTKSKVGVLLTIEKRLPLAGGQGGSAACAVAGAVAVNRLLGDPLDVNALLECALDAEGAVSGRHADNIAPSLLGGIALVLSIDPMDVVSLPVPAALRVVLAHPDQRLPTAEARDILPSFVARAASVVGALLLPAGAASVQRCESCRDTRAETDPAGECGCGGLLEVVHAEPDLHGAALMARFAQRRGTHPASEPSGVWQFREL